MFGWMGVWSKGRRLWWMQISNRNIYLPQSLCCLWTLPISCPLSPQEWRQQLISCAAEKKPSYDKPGSHNHHHFADQEIFYLWWCSSTESLTTGGVEISLTDGFSSLSVIVTIIIPVSIVLNKLWTFSFHISQCPPHCLWESHSWKIQGGFLTSPPPLKVQSTKKLI